jgi:electron transfer flavoprotein beta subunit
MTLRLKTPCLVTCVKELNVPRYMSVSGILDCYGKPLTLLDYAALKDNPLLDDNAIGLKGSPTNVYKSFSPPVKAAGRMLDGTPKDAVAQLVSILSAKHII